MACTNQRRSLSIIPPSWSLLRGTAVAIALLAFPLAATAQDMKPLETQITYEKIGTYDVDRLNRILTTEFDAFDETKVNYTPAQNGVTLYRVTYPSVIPEKANQPTMASGLIAIPEVPSKVLPMVSYQHGTVYGKQEVPSFLEQSYETRLMVAQFGGQGYIVIGADYFGKGTSKEKEGYVVMGSHQQACLDMYRASLYVLAKEGIQVSDFFIAGWSQGGLVTMAFLEKLESIGVPVKAASTSSAPVDPSMAMLGFMNFPRPNDAGWTTILFILSAFSFEEYYGLPGLAKALFTDEMYDTAYKIYHNELTDPNAFPTDIKKLVRPEYFDAQYFLTSAYGRILHDIHFYRWVIKTPTKMFYGENDEVISVGLGQLAANYQRSIGAGNTKVEAISAGPTTHRGTFAVAVREQKKWFDSLRSR